MHTRAVNVLSLTVGTFAFGTLPDGERHHLLLDLRGTSSGVKIQHMFGSHTGYWFRDPGLLVKDNSTHSPAGSGELHTLDGESGSYNQTLPLGGLPTATSPATIAGVLKNDGSGTVSRGGGDYLANLNAAEISITDAAAATVSRQHVVSGTGTDYTITLPAVAGNAGKFIAFRIASSATRLFTLDPNGAEMIDGASTRAMWAGESATLHCDGTSWAKVGGRSIPMSAEGRVTSVVSVNANAATALPLAATVSESVNGMVGTGVITARRPGVYHAEGLATYEVSGSYPGFESYCIIEKNGGGFAGTVRLTVTPTAAGGGGLSSSHPAVTGAFDLVAGD